METTIEGYKLHRLLVDDRSLHEEMSKEIVANLPREDFLLPMTASEYDDAFAEGAGDVILGLFDGDRLIATSALLHDTRAYIQQWEVREAMMHRCAEIGECMVLPAYRGKSLMLKLNQLLLQEAQALGIENLLATAHPENEASNNSLQRFGFRRVKTFTRSGVLRNLYVMKVPRNRR